MEPIIEKPVAAKAEAKKTTFYKVHPAQAHKPLLPWFNHETEETVNLAGKDWTGPREATEGDPRKEITIRGATQDDYDVYFKLGKQSPRVIIKATE